MIPDIRFTNPKRGWQRRGGGGVGGGIDVRSEGKRKGRREAWMK